MTTKYFHKDGKTFRVYQTWADSYNVEEVPEIKSVGGVLFIAALTLGLLWYVAKVFFLI